MKREVSQQFGISGDRRPPCPRQDRQGRCDIALGGLVNNGQVEGLALQRQDAVNVREIGEPNGQGSQQPANPDLVEIGRLPGARAGREWRGRNPAAAFDLFAALWRGDERGTVSNRVTSHGPP
jgi:hypothetical protein